MLVIDFLLLGGAIIAFTYLMRVAWRADHDDIGEFWRDVDKFVHHPLTFKRKDSGNGK